MDVFESVDYLELTYINARPDDALYPDAWSTRRVETKPRNGYKVAARYSDGRIEMHSDEQRMGVHVVMSGDVCKELGVNARTIFDLTNRGARVTRLDCATDVFNAPLVFEDLWALARAGEYQCRLRKPPLRASDAATGDTIYFGRMKSSACTRVYNKAAEQGVAGEWIRVETMFRHRRAHDAAKALVAGKSIRSLNRGHVYVPKLAWWVEAMNVPATKTRAHQKPRDSRMEWLLKSVAPALRKEIELHGESVWNDFRDAVWCGLDLT